VYKWLFQDQLDELERVVVVLRFHEQEKRRLFAHYYERERYAARTVQAFKKACSANESLQK